MGINMMIIIKQISIKMGIKMGIKMVFKLGMKIVFKIKNQMSIITLMVQIV